MMIATHKRDNLLRSLLTHLTTAPPPSLRHIVLIWQNVGTPLPAFLLPSALAEYTTTGVNVSVRISKVNSMNERFRPIIDWGEEVKTEAVMIMDDDVVLRKETLEWGYKAYLEANPLGSDPRKGRLTGFAGRDFVIKEDEAEVVYVVQPRKSYSMVLSNAAWLRKEWMEKYWDDTAEMKKLRDYVDEVFNCDDLLINYLVSNLTGLPPLLLQPIVPLRTIPTVGLWNRDSSTSTDEPSPSPSSSASPSPPLPFKLDHFSQRAVCLRYYFDHFSTFAPPTLNNEAVKHYPLVQIDSAVTQDVVDRARWLHSPDEPWEQEQWVIPPPPPIESDVEQEDEVELESESEAEAEEEEYVEMDEDVADDLFFSELIREMNGNQIDKLMGLLMKDKDTRTGAESEVLGHVVEDEGLVKGEEPEKKSSRKMTEKDEL